MGNTEFSEYASRLAEKPTQRFVENNSTYRASSREKELPKVNSSISSNVPPPTMVPHHTIGQTTLTQSTNNSSMKAVNIENISSKAYASEINVNRFEASASSLATSSAHALAAKQAMPQLIPSKFAASPVVNNRMSPVRKDKFAERLQNYGLLDSTAPAASTGESVFAYSSITPSTIRGRQGMHTPKPPRESDTLTQTTSKSVATSSSSTTIAQEPKRELINFKYLLAVLVATVVIYWLIVTQFQSNPENPVDF